MTTIYVREQGAVVRKRNERIVVTKEDRELSSIPLVNLEQVALIGNVQLTTPAAALLLEHDVDVVFFSHYFKYRGRLVGIGSKNAALRVAQMRRMSDETWGLGVARSVVVGKLTNQRVIMQRQAARRLGEPAIQQAIEGMAAMRAGAERAEGLETLRGYEGKGAAFYFAGVKVLLDPRWGFQGRAFYPPPDPINAALSLGYALLLKDMMAAVQIVGLDPYLGFFHAIEPGRPSLALDVMEEFRPLLVDTAVLALVNEGRLTPADFTRTSEEKRPVVMRDEGMRRLIEAYEQRLETTLHHPVTGDQVTYRRCLELQMRQIAALAQGKAERYVPVVIK